MRAGGNDLVRTRLDRRLRRVCTACPRYPTMSSTRIARREAHLPMMCISGDLVGARATLVDHRERAVEGGEGARALDAAGVGRDHGARLAADLVARWRSSTGVALQIVDRDVEEALDLSACRSMPSGPAEAPAVSIRSATSLALIGVRGATFRSWRA